MGEKWVERVPSGRVLELKRFSSLPFATYGVLSYLGIPICFTLELPWKDNKQNVSCIPEGEYSCRGEEHEHLGKCFRLEGVTGRVGILIHAANHVRELNGCIAPGLSMGPREAKPGVRNSRAAIQDISVLTGMAPFKLLILDTNRPDVVD